MINIFKSAKNFRNNFIWNAIGACFNAINSLLFIVIITRVLGIYEAGYFSLAFAVSVILSNIGLFNMRNFQITDINIEYSDNEYLNSRIITTIVMILLFIIVSCTKLQNRQMFLMLLLLGCWRVPEVLADAMHGTLQMNNRLDLAGKSVFLKALLCMVFFVFAIYGYKSTTAACLMITIANSVIFIFYDIRNYKKYCETIKFRLSQRVISLLVSCLPLFFIAILYSYILNAPKFFIDQFSSPEKQTVFSIIILPASIIWLIFSLIMNPLLPSMTVNYYSENRKKFFTRVGMLIFSITIVISLYIIAIKIVGIKIMEILYKTQLENYHNQFIIAGIGAGFLCIASVFSYMIIIARKMKILMNAYISISIVSYMVSKYLVRKYDLLGATISYTMIMAIMAISLMVIFIIVNQKAKGRAVYDHNTGTV